MKLKDAYGHQSLIDCSGSEFLFIAQIDEIIEHLSLRETMQSGAFVLIELTDAFDPPEVSLPATGRVRFTVDMRIQ